jgi:hypothetical protein
MKFEFNSIQFKKNKMQINEKKFQNLFMNIVLKKEELKKKEVWKTSFYISLLDNGLN